jgi:hypothetical protein
MSIPLQDNWGQVLYEMQLKKFRGAFAPKWDELDDLTKQQWLELAKQFDGYLQSEHF